MPDLTRKQQLFISYYIESGNASQAAIQAGYSKNGVRSTASTILTNPNVQREIEERMDAVAQAAGLTKEKVLRELKRLAFTDMRDYVEWGPQGVTLRYSDTLTDDQAKAVIKVSEHKTV